MTFNKKEAFMVADKGDLMHTTKMLYAALDQIRELEKVLIEEAAKAIFFRDMVDGEMSTDFYDIWEVETEPNVETGEKIQERYRARARKNLAGDLI